MPVLATLAWRATLFAPSASATAPQSLLARTAAVAFSHSSPSSAPAGKSTRSPRRSQRMGREQTSAERLSSALGPSRALDWSSSLLTDCRVDKGPQQDWRRHFLIPAISMTDSFCELPPPVKSPANPGKRPKFPVAAPPIRPYLSVSHAPHPSKSEDRRGRVTRADIKDYCRTGSRKHRPALERQIPNQRNGGQRVMGLLTSRSLSAGGFGCFLGARDPRALSSALPLTSRVPRGSGSG